MPELTKEEKELLHKTFGNPFKKKPTTEKAKQEPEPGSIQARVKKIFG